MNPKEFESRVRTVETRLKPPAKRFLSIAPHHVAMLEAGGEQAERLNAAIRELCGGVPVKLYLPSVRGEVISPDNWKDDGCPDVARLDEILNRLTSG
jgi:hypothetical protein